MFVLLNFKDLAQNEADSVHLDFVHTPSLCTAVAGLDGFWSKWLSLLGNVTQKTSWEPDADNPHVSWSHNEVQVELLKKISIPNRSQLKCVCMGT